MRLDGDIDVKSITAGSLGISRKTDSIEFRLHGLCRSGGFFQRPTRIPLTFQRKNGQIVLDQIRAVDKTRLVKRMGKLDKDTASRTLAVLQEMFTE